MYISKTGLYVIQAMKLTSLNGLLFLAIYNISKISPRVKNIITVL